MGNESSSESPTHHSHHGNHGPVHSLPRRHAPTGGQSVELRNNTLSKARQSTIPKPDRGELDKRFTTVLVSYAFRAEHAHSRVWYNKV